MTDCEAPPGTDVTDAPPMLNKSDEDLELDHKQHEVPIVVLPERPAYTQTSFQDSYQYVEDQQDECCPSQCECLFQFSPRCVWNFIKARVPMLEWMQYYNLRNNIASDIIAGITVGVMHIPQGMAYAMLGQVPTVLGLYVSFFPVLIYFFLGTSHHVSVGTFAIICLMLSKIVRKHQFIPDYEPPPELNITTPFVHLADKTTVEPMVNVTEVSLPEAITAVDVATAVCLVTGITHILMGVLRLGSLSSLLSETLISGFTTGAAFHVFTSQVTHLFGLSVSVKTPYFAIFFIYKEMFSHILESNYISVIISVLALICLGLVNECINARYRGKMKMPVPIELILIIIATSVSYFTELNVKHHVKIVGPIPTGLPQPKVPQFKLVAAVALDTIALSVIAFTISLSMGMIFAKKHKYEIRPNQELFALGFANVFSSFFSCFPCCVSLSRSMVQETAGGKTQVASLVSCLLVLIVVLFIGPLFENLPTAILAAIIVIALKGMFLQFRDLKQAWKVSPLEGLIWLVSFLSVLVTDVDVGLAIGVIFSLCTVIFRTLNCQLLKIRFALPHTCLLGRVIGTDIYVELERYKESREIPGVKIFHFSGPLYFGNRAFFKTNLCELIGVNPRLVTASLQKREVMKKKEKDSRLREVRKQRKQMERREHMVTEDSADLDGESEGNAKIVNTNETYEESDNDTLDKAIGTTNGDISHDTSVVPIHHIIMDCSAWTYIDSSGMTTLVQIVQEYQDVNVTVFLASCTVPVLELFDKLNFPQQVPGCCVFPTVHDAVIYACQGKELILSHSSSESNF